MGGASIEIDSETTNKGVRGCGTVRDAGRDREGLGDGGEIRRD